MSSVLRLLCRSHSLVARTSRPISVAHICWSISVKKRTAHNLLPLLTGQVEQIRNATSIQKRLLSDARAVDNSGENDNNEGETDSPPASSGGDSGGKDDGKTTPPESSSPPPGSVFAMEIPEVFPIIPIVAVNRHPLFPKFIKVIEVTDPDTRNLIIRRLHLKQPYVGVFLRKDDLHISDVIHNTDDVHSIGSFCFIHEIEDLGSRLKIVVGSIRRIKILNSVDFATVEDNKDDKDNKDDILPVNDVNKTLLANTCNIAVEPYEFTDEIRALGGEIILAAREIMSRNPLYRDIFHMSAIRGQTFADNPEHLGDLGAVLSTASSNDLQQVLAEMNIKNRLRLSLNLLKKEVEIMRLQQKIGEEVEERIKTHNRKVMLQEQMRIIKRELGLEKDDKTSISDKFKGRLEGLTVPAHVREVIDEELNKLSFLDAQSAEFNVTRSYLEWLTALPWGTTSEETLDVEQARKILNEDHYGMDDVKNRILEFIAVSRLKNSTQGKILCFVGPPGVGKTSIAKSIARALNRDYFRFSVGGLTDIAEIKGHRRTYVGAMPGKIIQCMKKVKSENPLVLIDEIDKIGRAAYHGDPSSALLEMLDPEQNANFLDHYLDVSVDLSKVLFLCTANVMDTIPAPLLDRMEVIQVSGYVAEEKLEIAKNYLIPTAAKESGVPLDKLEFTDEALNHLNKYYCRESGVRNLQKQIEKIYRKIAMKIVKEDEEDREHVKLTETSLSEYIGKPVFPSTRMYDITPPGVVTGLAWTSLGGATLYIETAIIPANDAGSVGGLSTTDFKITGNVGDVMRESAQIAMTYAKVYMSTQNPENSILRNRTVHLHIPEGASPKDGPSAGCTIVTALVSLATGMPTKPNVAMTGEISLKGKILPVGGIKEKLIAAKRGGITTVILPADNKKDYDELPLFIKDNLQIHFADSFHDIANLVF